MDIAREGAELREALNIRVSRESYILALICAADMISTIWLVRGGKAIEANPILIPFMERGIGCFFVAKSMLFLVPLFTLELLRSKRPLFVKKMLRVGIAAYLLSYTVGVINLNVTNRRAATQVAAPSNAP